MYQRDKNHPCITMWSLGNESGGYECRDVCYSFLKKENPEIPVHYEGVTCSERWAYDVVSNMYVPYEKLRKIMKGKAGDKYKGKPFFQCEYAHAMGNGPGGLEEYMQLFYSCEQFLGGCIWEWADHSVYDENAKYKWTYGGDNNEPIHDGNFCVDGLFYPDCRPSSGALEMKAVYRPIRAKYVNHSIELWNTMSFADSSDINIGFEVLVDGEIKEQGSLEAVVEAEKKKIVSLGKVNVDYPNSDVFINIIYTDKASGFETAREQLACLVQNIRIIVSGTRLTKTGKAILSKNSANPARNTVLSSEYIYRLGTGMNLLTEQKPTTIISAISLKSCAQITAIFFASGLTVPAARAATAKNSVMIGNAIMQPFINISPMPLFQTAVRIFGG